MRRGSFRNWFPCATWAKVFPNEIKPTPANPDWIVEALREPLPVGWTPWAEPRRGGKFPRLPFDEAISKELTGEARERASERFSELGLKCPYFTARLFLIRALVVGAIEEVVSENKQLMATTLQRTNDLSDDLVKHSDAFKRSADDFRSFAPGVIGSYFLARHSYIERIDEESAMDRLNQFIRIERGIKDAIDDIFLKLNDLQRYIFERSHLLVSERKRFLKFEKGYQFDRAFIQVCGEFWFVLTGMPPSSSDGPSRRFIDACYSTASREDLRKEDEVDVSSQIRALNDYAKKRPAWDRWQRVLEEGPRIASIESLLRHVFDRFEVGEVVGAITELQNVAAQLGTKLPPTEEVTRLLDPAYEGAINEVCPRGRSATSERVKVARVLSLKIVAQRGNGNEGRAKR